MADIQTIKEKIKINENVEEVLNKIHSKIDENNENILVLKGVRGSGRTTVLLTKEAKNSLGEEISIYHNFEHAGIGVTGKDVGTDFIKHRFELEMTSVFLNYLIQKGILDTQIEAIAEEVKNLRRLFVYDINNLGISKEFKSKILRPGYYTQYLAQKIKSIYYPEKFSFLVDRFDWMFNRSIEAQKCIKDYFYLFDQVVLTTDDDSYSAKYPTIEVNYGKEKEVVKEIIRKHIEKTKNNESRGKYLDLSYISEDTLDFIIEKANGDIESILRTINSLCCDNDFHLAEDLNNDIRNEIMNQVNERQKVKQPEHLHPKFYV